MSPDIALSLIARTTTMDEKSSPNISDTKPTTSRETTQGYSTTVSTFSLTSLKPFFTLPSPTTTPTRKMPALLMLATTALLFTCSGNIIPPANASVISTSPSTTSPSTHPEINTKTRNTTIKLTQKEDGHQDPCPCPIAWDTPCTHPGEEGIWNCMATTWQRCVQGRWSVIMRSGDPGTICVPGGITRDVKFVPEGQGEGDGGQGEGQGQGQGGGQGGGEQPQAKWGGGGWNGGGNYWSGVDGGRLGRERVVVVLGVAGGVGFVMGRL